MSWYKLDKKYTSIYFLLSALGLLYILPVILLNIYFKDDLGWSLTGSIGLKGDGRPLGEYLVLLLCGGNPITDTAPLPLILLVLFLSYTLVLYAKKNLTFLSSNYVVTALLLSILTNPLSIECLVYRYGSLVMFAALGIPFLIFSIPDNTSKIKILLYSAVLSMALMSLYQPALGMCLVLFLINIFFVVVDDKKLDYLLEGTRLAGIGIGAIIYKTVIVSHYINNANDWRFGASQTVSLRLDSIKIILQNIVTTCSTIHTLLVETPLWYRAAIGLMILLAILLTLISFLRRSSQQTALKALSAAFLALSPFFVFFATFLPMMLLSDLTLKGRMLISFGGFLFYLEILMFHSIEKTKKAEILSLPLTALVVLCIFYHYTYLYSYGSALNIQTEYAKYIVYNVAHDLETINADNEYTEVSFIGTMPKTKRLQRLYDKYPSYYFLLPRYFTNDTWVGGAWVMHYLQDDLLITADNETDRQIADSGDPVVKNSIYACYLNDDKIIVSFE